MLQGTGFPLSERERLGIRGLLPHKVLNVETQVGTDVLQILGICSAALALLA